MASADVISVLQGRGGGVLPARRIYRGGVYDLEGAGFLSTAFKEILPLLGRAIVPRLARAAARVGSDILTDVQSGTSLKEATKRGLKRGLERAKAAAIQRLRGGGRRRRKVGRPKRNKSTVKHTRRSQRLKKRRRHA
jgi:hypothetical protein